MTGTVHHVNCATLRPFGGRLIDGRGSSARRARLVCHCLLVETADGLVLVDTGIGTRDIADPEHRLGPDFLQKVRPVLNMEETALRQVVALGFSPADVRHIVLTHLDRDHAGGLADFPDAQVHVHGPALDAALDPATGRDRDRHRSAQWTHKPRWRAHRDGGDPWFGFDAMRVIPGCPDLLLVPLPGHSTGHAGVGVRTGAEGGRWLLHAGDAYFFHGEMHRDAPRCPPGLRLFQHRAQASRRQRHATQQRLRALTRSAPQVRVVSSHDASELPAGAAPR